MILPYKPLATGSPQCHGVARMQDTGPPRKPLISIIDDDESFRDAMGDLMRSAGFAVAVFPSAVEFLASADAYLTSCIITDVHMPQMSGIELHNRLLASGHAIPTILMTAYPNDNARDSALANGVLAYLTKPCDETILFTCVQSAVEGSESKEDPS
jgi:FixJ family two-component response regulator